MHRRRLLALVAVVSVLGALIATQIAPAQADDLPSGQFLPAFSPGADGTHPRGLYADAPPATVQESTQYPAAVSDVALPNGKFVYWNGLENLESAQYPLPLNATDKSLQHPSRSLQLTLSGDGGGSDFKQPSPDWGAAMEDGYYADLFCSDQRILLDGTVFDAGGTVWKNDPVDLKALTGDPNQEPGGTTELFGSKAARIYKSNASGGTWTTAQYMHYGRWYPAMLTLPDGRLFVAGGVGRLLYNMNADPSKGPLGSVNVRRSEIFDPYTSAGAYSPSTGSWTDLGDDMSLPLFPRLHLIPGGSDGKGRIFWGSNGQMWGPFGQSQDEALWNEMKLWDVKTQAWSDAGLAPFGARSGAAEVLLPFTPDSSGNYTTTRVLQAGGVLGTSPGSFVANSLANVITIDGDSISSERVGDLNNRRWYSSSVIGPDGNVYVFSGADKDEVVCGGCETAVRQAEEYDVATKTWIPLASSVRDRTYHNSAILMSDGRILVGGHSPINTDYGPGESDVNGQPVYTSNDQHNATTAVAGDQGTANNLKDPSLQIFDPPYLHRGPAPVIGSNLSADIDWGATQPIQTPDAVAHGGVGQVDDAILIHMPASTHVTDADMRAVVLPITDRSTSTVKVHVPTDPSVLPPGYYYLFLRRTNAGYDQPAASNGVIVRIGSSTVFGGAANAIAQAKVGSLGASSKAASHAGSLPAIATAVTEHASIGVSRGSSKGSPRDGLIAAGIAALVAAAGAGMRTRRRATAA